MELILDHLIELISLILVSFGSYAIIQIGKFFKEKTGIEITPKLEKEFELAVEYAKKELKGDTEKVNHLRTKKAYEYVKNNAPRWLNELNYTPKMIENKIQAMLLE